MKRNLRPLLASMAILIFSINSHAQGTLIHYWNFNSFARSMHTDTIHGINANYSKIDTNKAQILYAEIPGTSAAFSSYVDSVTAFSSAPDFDTVNERFGDSSGTALRARNPTDSMQLLFYIPTTHYKNIVLKYASQSSSISHGPLHQIFSYSLDSGMTWKTTGGLSEQSDSAYLYYHLITVAFTDTQTNNTARLVFRINFSGNDTGTHGNNRFDNVTVEGDSIISTPPSVVNQINLKSAEYTIYPNPVVNTLNVRGTVDETASIVIYNSEGKAVISELMQPKYFSVNTTSLDAGVYIIKITGSVSGKVTTMRFIKE